MSNTNTGGPAFPGPYANENGNLEVLFKQQGMTLRDYFAAKAMQGLLAGKLTSTDLQLIANDCYAMADAMLAVRSNT